MLNAAGKGTGDADIFSNTLTVAGGNVRLTQGQPNSTVQPDLDRIATGNLKNCHCGGY